MEELARILLKIVFEIVLYLSGKAVAIVVFPRLVVAPYEKQRTSPKFWSFSFTYTKNGKKHLYTESVVFIGLCFWVVVGLLVALAVWSKT